MRTFVRLLMVQIVLITVPAVASAQTGAALTGVVTDSTGAVLPGVTVEARSPALIEQVRSAVTDETGRYRIVDLRPGTYSGGLATRLCHSGTRRNRALRFVHCECERGVARRRLTGDCYSQRRNAPCRYPKFEDSGNVTE